MKYLSISILVVIGLLLYSCKNQETNDLSAEVYETSAAGKKLDKLNFVSMQIEGKDSVTLIQILPEEKFQTITGFGGSFTESSAFLLNQLSKEKRAEILEAYFHENGAGYSLTRTHINSCDFSLGHYSYTPTADKNLDNFSVKEDMDDIIPMIKEAQEISKEGFKIIASPWTAPPWMKDNNDWIGGKLLPEYYDTWALFFSKYLKAYNEQGINIWGITVENEPHGNGNNWESMHYSPEEMTYFVQNYLGPKLENEGYSDVVLMGYDQNRAGIKEWAQSMYKDENTSKYFDGMAIHWYESTYDFFPEALQYAHQKAPDKYLIQTEACVDSEVPHWKDDAWYWRKEATDWGWDWAPEDQKYLHPKYVPVYRYARDIIGCLNNWVDGWVDWNMVLDQNGGPNWFENWCVAPILVNIESDEVYYTPLYYTMAHFSKYIRPGAQRIGFENPDHKLMLTAVQNPDKSIVCVLFNPSMTPKEYELQMQKKNILLQIDAQAIQTIIINQK